MAIKSHSVRQQRGEKRVFREPKPMPVLSNTFLQKIKNSFSFSDIPSTQLLFKALWFVFLGIVYTYTQNQYDKLTYQTSRAKREMNEKRAVYISKKAEYMYASKHSEISKKLAERGLDKNLMPPIKIVTSEE